MIDACRARTPLSATPFAALLGLQPVELAPDVARLRLPHRAENGNRNGTLHGGALASLVAMAGTAAAEGDLHDDRLDGTLVDLAVHFLAPATAEDVIAEATVARRGRAISFVTVAVTSDAGIAIARGMVAYRAGRRGRRAPGHATPGPRPAEADLDLPASRRSRSPLSQRLGIYAAGADGVAIAVLPAQPGTLRADGTIHEGALATLVDCAGGRAAWSLFGMDRRGRASTLGMHLACDVTPRGEDVVAEARATWSGGGMFVSAATLRGRTTGRVVASGSVTYRIVAREPD
jgi:acyl-CoA thioesterase